MSEWTHNICVPCWNEQNPDRPTDRVGLGSHDTCCFCGTPNDDGIYMRHDPKELDCEHEGAS